MCDKIDRHLLNIDNIHTYQHPSLEIVDDMDLDCNLNKLNTSADEAGDEEIEFRVFVRSVYIITDTSQEERRSHSLNFNIGTVFKKKLPIDNSHSASGI